jgi:O-antigen/teichoic acid export membrane protein
MTERASIPSNIRWLATSSLAVKPFWFLFLLWASRQLGPDEFGRSMYALSVVSLVAVFLEGGIDVHLVRSVAGRPGEAARLLARTLPLKFFAFGATIGGTLLVGLVARPEPGLLPLLLAAAVVTALTQLTLHFRALFRAYETMAFEARSAMIEKGVTMLLCGAALVLAPFAGPYLAAMAIAAALTFFWTAARAFRTTGVVAWNLDPRGAWREVLRPALPYALMSIFTILYFRSGTLALATLTGRDDIVGWFNAGYRLVEAYMLFPAIIMTPLYPVFARTFLAREGVTHRIGQGARFVLILTTLAAVPLALHAETAALLLFGEAYRPAAPAIRILALAMFPIGMNYVFGTLVAAAGRQARANVVIVLATLLNVALNLLLVPRIGLAGAAVTTVITECVLAAGNYVLVRDFADGRQMASLALRAILVIAVAVALHLSGVLGGLPDLARAFGTGSVLVLGLLVTRLAQPADARHFLRAP